MKLDLSSLQSALASFERALKFSQKIIDDKSFSDDEKEVIKAGVIQNFKSSYELCWKFMKRWLEQNYSESFTAGITRKQLFRYAAENLLIEDCDAWMHFHELRNKTSHTYDREVAEEIVEAAGNFFHHSRLFYKAIEARND
ncbi:MAG: putative nucleotidyltransferase [Candidatus Brocadiaceae bacterium]|nr:putative nucleotidyltransferase [Candidatus Brocadiaceae bacterium]